LSIPSSPQSFFSKFQKERYEKFLKGAIVELGFHHYHFLPLHNHFHFTYHSPFIHYIPYIPYTCTFWFDCMTCSSGSMVWLCNKCLQVCVRCLPTYELHISLLDVGWERRHNVTVPNAKNITHLERRDKAYLINALVRIQKYHKGEIWEGHTKESLSFIWKSCKTPE
jgi:hypothetical protein